MLIYLKIPDFRKGQQFSVYYIGSYSETSIYIFRTFFNKNKISKRK